MKALREAWRHVWRSLTGPTYGEVADAGRALAQAVVDTAHDRAFNHYKDTHASEPGDAILAREYADDKWELFLQLHEGKALQTFNELFTDGEA